MAMIFADTHVLVWLASDSKRLPARAREQLLAEEQLAVSAVTAWEYVELHQRGRFDQAPAFDELVTELSLQSIDFPADAWRLSIELPPLHTDPIDRMLIAHAMLANAELATADAQMRRYPVKKLW
jgi:PIN domain nuclease of toxin-antitoxin system